MGRYSDYEGPDVTVPSRALAVPETTEEKDELLQAMWALLLRTGLAVTLQTIGAVPGSEALKLRTDFRKFTEAHTVENEDEYP